LALNKVLPAALALLPQEQRPRVRHQTGVRTLDQATAAYAKHNVDAELLPFIDDMAQAYAWADLVVCRAGALTVAELQAAGVAAIFIPFPAAVDDHQTANAGTMASAGAAQILQERDLSDESLAAILKQWLHSREKLCAKAQLARSLGYPQALARITDVCLEVAGAST
jgi:UDP-N-acetylglucosamine--N-acetylmuramyl-(pentapeptide) pyrophosphoryl-undecaprenol N-acetylglucosamine transferase